MLQYAFFLQNSVDRIVFLADIDPGRTVKIADNGAILVVRAENDALIGIALFIKAAEINIRNILFRERLSIFRRVDI